MRKIRRQVKIGAKTDLKTESVSVFENFRFVATARQRSRRATFGLPIGVLTSLFLLRSLVNTTPRHVNVLTCLSVLPLTCSVHCLGLLERHNIGFFSANVHSRLISRSRKLIKCM